MLISNPIIYIAIRVWINSLDIGHHIKNLAEELTDGILILKVMDKVVSSGTKTSSSFVNWKVIYRI